MDKDSNGVVVEHDFCISQEHRQRCKNLSCPKQINERKTIAETSMYNEYCSQFKLYELEKEQFDLNTRCENKLIIAVKKSLGEEYLASGGDPNCPDDSSFQSISHLVGIEHFKPTGVRRQDSKLYPTSPELTAFFCVRSNISVQRGKLAFASNSARNKAALIDNAISVLNKPLLPRLFPQAPNRPSFD